MGVEFDKKEQYIKLFMVDASGKGSHETYKVDGWLRRSGHATAPTATSKAQPVSANVQVAIEVRARDRHRRPRRRPGPSPFPN